MNDAPNLDPQQAPQPSAPVDPVQDSSTAVSASDTGAAQTASLDDKASGQSPLDALEQILQQAKASKSGGAAPDAQAQIESQKKQEELAKFEALKEQKNLEDAQAMAAKIAELQQVSEMPQQQARVQQDEAKEAEKQEQEAAKDGFEINQIDHTKI